MIVMGLLTSTILSINNDISDHVPEGMENAHIIVVVLGIEFVQSTVVCIE